MNDAIYEGKGKLPGIKETVEKAAEEEKRI